MQGPILNKRRFAQVKDKATGRLLAGRQLGSQYMADPDAKPSFFNPRPMMQTSGFRRINQGVGSSLNTAQQNTSMRSNVARQMLGWGAYTAKPRLVGGGLLGQGGR